MTRAVAVAVLCLPLMASAEPSEYLLKSDGYAEAYRVFEAGSYDLAARRFASLLSNPEEVNLTTADKNWLKAQTARAHIRANQPEAALDIIRNLNDDPEADFWRAQALVQLGRFSEADSVLKMILAADDPMHEDSCRLTRARVVSELGRHAEAVEELNLALGSKDQEVSSRARVALAQTLIKLGRHSEVEGLFDPSIGEPYQSQLRYLVGLAVIEEPNFQLAKRTFEEVLELRGRLPEELIAGSEIGLAIALANLGQEEKAVQYLIQMIDAAMSGEPAGQSLLLEGFATFESLGLLNSPEVQERLNNWSEAEHMPHLAIARYYSLVALEASGKQADALPHYIGFTESYPDHPLVPQALLRQAVLYAVSAREDGREEALKSLQRLQDYPVAPEAKKLIDFLKAQAEFAIADSVSNSVSKKNEEIAVATFRKSVEDFVNAGKNGDAETLEVTNYDAAIAALRADFKANLDPFLSAIEGNRELRGNLLIERGLYLAANQHYREARLALEECIAAGPLHPRTFQAYLALAEIAIHDFPSHSRKAIDCLALAAKSATTDLQQQQLAYTRFWVEESKRGEDQTAVVKLGLLFLENEKWEESPWRAAVRMKLGEHYFRNGNYPPAREMFEELERESPDAELAEAALYFAGKAHMRLGSADGADRAIKLWGRVVKGGGGLSIPARYQQALAYRRQSKFDEAAAILRVLTENEQVSGEERHAFLCSLGEILFSQFLSQSPNDLSKLKEAIQVFETVVANSEHSPRWRNQALFRLAKCQESAGDIVSAKNAYEKVFATPATPVPDFVWSYRAGIEFVKLLEKEEDWDTAIHFAKRLSNSSYPRAKEAEDIAARLTLKHFRWPKRNR